MDERNTTLNSEGNSSLDITFGLDDECFWIRDENNLINFQEYLDFSVHEPFLMNWLTEYEHQDIFSSSEQCTDLDFPMEKDEESGPNLFEREKDINKTIDLSGNTALHIAVQNEPEYVVLELLKNGADVNKKNIYGNTSVHEAVIQGNLKTLKILIENGGDINMTGQCGLLPLEMAPISWDENCLDAILACNPDINKKDERGNTTLIHYVNEYYKKTSDILKLLEYGCDPNITNKSGWNCLHIIASEWHLAKGPLVRILMDYGININAEIPRVKITPLHMAYSNIKNEYLVHILLQNDAIFTKNWKKIKPFDIVSWGNLQRICAHGALREHRWKELRRITYLKEVSESLFSRIFKRCKRELEIIKLRKIEGFSLTYYDFLFCSREESCKLSLKKQFRVEIAKSVQYFSIYSDFLMDKLYQGIQLRRANIDACFFLCELLHIPYVCAEEILKYFTTEELLQLQRRLEISS